MGFLKFGSRCMIQWFHAKGGFSTLADYLSVRINTPLFTLLEFLHQILNALVWCRSQSTNWKRWQVVCKGDGRSCDHGITSCDGLHEQLHQWIHQETTTGADHHLSSRVFAENLWSSRCLSSSKATYKFYSFWRGLILKLITSRSLPLRLTGWEQLKDCIEACKNHRPPPKMFEVSQAGGLQFVNGIFEFAGVMHYSWRVCPVFPERTWHCFVVQCAHSKNGGFYLRQTKSNWERIETLIITSTSRRKMRSCNLPLAWLGNMPKCRHWSSTAVVGRRSDGRYPECCKR